VWRRHALKKAMSVMRSTPNPLQPFSLLMVSAAVCGTTLTLALLSQGRSHRAMSTSSLQKPWPTKAYQPRHISWPYQDIDFARQDPRSDLDFYSSPRFVTHIDDAAISSLREYYDAELPRRGRILDLCSSWISHYPRSVEQAAASGTLKVTGMGMNRAELERNEVLNHGRVVIDLNRQPDVPLALREAGVPVNEQDGLDASTMVVSIDYLTRPVEVLRSLREVTRDGGKVHLAVSNRCFPTKVIARWSRIDEKERLLMVGDFLHFAGWKSIDIVELSDGKADTVPDSEQSGGLKALMASLGMNGRDPLWIVRGVKG
jgi:hypothetical protein